MKKIEFKKGGEVEKLIKSCATSAEDRQAFAEFVEPVVQEVLEHAMTSNMVYTEMEYDSDDYPSIPLELFEGNQEGLIDVMSHSISGGLPTNHIAEIEDYRVNTRRFDSAVSLGKRTAERARLPIVSKSIERMVSEIAVKMEHQAWSVVFAALGNAQTNGNNHLVTSDTPTVFGINDLNKLITKTKRLRNSWVEGTPTSLPGEGLTHVVFSPEMMEQVRAMSYQSFDSNNNLPAGERAKIFSNVGTSNLWDKELIELNEFGLGQAYNRLFAQFYSGAFNAGTQEIILGLDLSTDGGVKAVSADSDRGSQITVMDDDQWVKRSKKIGWYAEVECGWAWVQNKALTGIIV